MGLALADVAKTGRRDLLNLDQTRLFGGVEPLNLGVQVRTPGEEPFGKAAIELWPDRAVPVKAGVLGPPPAKKALGRPWYVRIERPRDVPAGGALVDPVECVLVYQQSAPRPQKPGDPIEATRKILDVMQRPTRNDRVKRILVLEVLKRDPAKNRSARCLGVDGNHSMPGSRHCPRELAGSASDLQDPRVRGQVLQHE